MPLATLIEDVAAALAPIKAQSADLSIYAGWWDVPTPPAIDIYPASPFQLPAGFGAGNNQVFLTVRARVLLTDVSGSQNVLLRMLDPSDPASVEVALRHVAAAVEASGFTVFADDAPANERMIGCDWRITTFL